MAPRAPGRNEPCHCGSRRKYKRCCLERDAAAARQEKGAGLPPWIVQSRGKLQQFVKYACEVYELPLLLRRLTVRRRDPEIRTFDVVNSLFQAALLRLPSINALEGDLKLVVRFPAGLVEWLPAVSAKFGVAKVFGTTGAAAARTALQALPAPLPFDRRLRPPRLSSATGRWHI